MYAITSPPDPYVAAVDELADQEASVDVDLSDLATEYAVDRARQWVAPLDDLPLILWVLRLGEDDHAEG